MEFEELVEFLALAGVFDGLAGDRAHGKRRTAAGVAIELGKDDAGDADGLVEVLCDRHRLLAGGGIRDEERFLRSDEIVQALEFGDERLVDFLAAGGVEDEDGALLFLRPDEGIPGDLDDVGFGGFWGVARDVDLLCEHRQLVDGGGAIEVDRR